MENVCHTSAVTLTYIFLVGYLSEVTVARHTSRTITSYTKRSLFSSGDVLLCTLHRTSGDAHQCPHHPRHHRRALLRNLPSSPGQKSHSVCFIWGSQYVMITLLCELCLSPSCFFQASIVWTKTKACATCLVSWLFAFGLTAPIISITTFTPDPDTPVCITSVNNNMQKTLDKFSMAFMGQAVEQNIKMSVYAFKVG